MEDKNVEKEQKETITFTVDGISNLKYSVFSSTRICQNLPWSLNVVPCKKEKLGLFLYCNVKSKSGSKRKWSCSVNASLKILRHNGLSPFCRQLEHKFCEEETSWGYSQFILWNDLFNSSYNYVKDDKMIIEADLKVGPLLGVRKLCGTCMKLGYLSESRKHCSETLCADCVLDHKKFRDLLSHHIIAIDIASNKYFDFSKFCPDHPELAQDFYCSTHEQLCCRRCIADTHKCCENIKPLEVVSNGIKESSMYEDFQKELTDLSESAEQFEKYNEKWVGSKNVARVHLRNTTANIRQHIDDLEEQLLQKIESSNPVSNFDETNPIKDDVKEKCKEFEFISNHGSESQIFMLMLKLKPNIASNKKKVEDIASTKSSSELVFEEEDIISMIKSIGNINIKTEPCSTLSSSQKMKQAEVDTNKSEQ